MVRCMQRTNIYLEDRQTTALDELAAAQGVPRSEVVRRFIDAGLAARDAEQAHALLAITESFGALRDDDVKDAERSLTERDAHLQRLWAV